MPQNFITNNTHQLSLKERLNTLIGVCDELKFLVGFFYFSGWKEVYESLQTQPDVKLKLLVGLQVDKLLNQVIVEHGNYEESLPGDEAFERFISSLTLALDTDEVDTEAFHQQVFFFLDMLATGRLQIRKTDKPNHSKLYLFKLQEQQARVQGMQGSFITGSSNFTGAGLSGQQEFNVEIRDYGFSTAESYFDDLWDNATKITEDQKRKEIVIELVKNKSLIADVTPFEAYALVLKTFLDLQEQNLIRSEVIELLRSNYSEFSYQVDAVNQALNIINEYGGVIIADVVGLGKSVIASMIAKSIDKKTLILCPPGLIGNKDEKTGWYEYANNFNLNCNVRSKGELEKIAEGIDNSHFEVVIVDEAHSLRNQDTYDYDALKKICQGKKVILMTATPFNNSPADIFSLLKFFLIPGNTNLAIDGNIENLFTDYKNVFDKLSYISKYHNWKRTKATEVDKKEKAKRYHNILFGSEKIDLKLVRTRTKELANTIKHLISPVVIRRNRLDLQNDIQYNREIGTLSEVENPTEMFYELTAEQSKFYDKVLSEYFGEDGRFTGAIYRPFAYTGTDGSESTQQTNLYDFMRRLLVKRFESSFGAFASSVNRFLTVHKLAIQFVEKTGGRYILDRDLLEELVVEKDNDTIEDKLNDFENQLSKRSKNNTVYEIKTFINEGKTFLSDINKDIKLFEEIKSELARLEIVDNDPKRDAIYNQIVEILNKVPTKNEPKRKVLVFSEYVDTVKHLKPFMESKFGNRLLVCDGNISKQLHSELNSNFNAQYKYENTDNFDVLITSDKLSEGFNLNRAGAIINYDIPWNPTRVIQRVGRINRIGIKVFDKLNIYNFFPSERGKDLVQVRLIAEQKMYMIHNALGEDSKIFDPLEEPSASGLFKKLNSLPQEEGNENIATSIRNRYEVIKNEYPEVVEKIATLPNRVKTAKEGNLNQLCLLMKRGLCLYPRLVGDTAIDEIKVNDITLEEYIELIQCDFETPKLPLSDKFWKPYQLAKEIKKANFPAPVANSLEAKALTNLKQALPKLANEPELFEFNKTLITDLRKYRTLSDYILRRLGSISVENNFPDWKEELQAIMRYIGKDYLIRLLEAVGEQKNEVVIAIELSC